MTPDIADSPSSLCLPDEFTSLFDDPSAWMVVASGQATGHIRPIAGPEGKVGICLEYDFHGGGGFVVARRVWEMRLPPSFALGFSVSGAGLPNHFEFKVADPSGANAWRYQRMDCPLPETWQAWQLTERDLPFAWGPAGGGPPSAVGALEFVVAAGPGGRGSLCLSAPNFQDESFRAPARVRASSAALGHAATAVAFAPAEVSGAWRAAASDATPWWFVDLGKICRFGGIVIRWPENVPPRAYTLEIADTGEDDETGWRTVYRAARAAGRLSHLYLPGCHARCLRFTFAAPDCAGLAGLELWPDAYSSTPNAFLHAVAADYPRGWHPRYWQREQSYWTPIGTPEGTRRALINEEGLVEVDEAGFSLEPFLMIAGTLMTWDDAAIELYLPHDGIPLPEVLWRLPGITLRVSPWVDGPLGDQVLRVTYRLEKLAEDAPAVRLWLAVRPFQVNPPWQAFRNLGGWSPIHTLAVMDGGLRVGARPVFANRPAVHTAVATFDEAGIVPIILEMGSGPITAQGQREVNDPRGLASGGMAFDILAGRAEFAVTVAVPYARQNGEFPTDVGAGAGYVAAAEVWRATLGHVRWNVPAVAEPAVACFRTAAAHILINRDGPALQPGPRRYTRSWIRDSVIMGDAMAKAGCPEILRDFMRWYVPFQREDGFVPCVVDRDGVDWLVEHDSHGQFLWALQKVWQDAAEPNAPREFWSAIERAAEYLIALRVPKSRVADAPQPLATLCAGLLPESASHEGYLAHPVHSYWDDFWAVRGLQAAAAMATAIGQCSQAEQWHTVAADLEADLLRSIQGLIAERGLSYIPGSVEWADFDPTATANAIAMLDFADVLPQSVMTAMHQIYLEGFRKKRDGLVPWVNYTAYEIRIMGALVRLGHRAEAHELLAFFLSDRRPIEWNQWPEISWRDRRAPGHLGDVPHTWIAAEYLLAFAAMVADEQIASQRLVLAAGMPWDWIFTGSGFACAGLPTRWGKLDLFLHARQAGLLYHIHASIDGPCVLPPGGLVLAPPLPSGFIITQAALADGLPCPILAGCQRVVVPSLPARLTLTLATPELSNQAAVSV